MVLRENSGHSINAERRYSITKQNRLAALFLLSPYFPTFAFPEWLDRGIVQLWVVNYPCTEGAHAAYAEASRTLQYGPDGSCALVGKSMRMDV